MKHFEGEARNSGVKNSFPNTEIPEDDVQNILDIHPPGQSAQRRRGNPQFLGNELFAAPRSLRQSAPERRHYLFKRMAVTRSGHQS